MTQAPESCRHGNDAPSTLLANLPPSQGGSGRHKCPVCAYRAGLEAGITEGIRLAQEAVSALGSGSSDRSKSPLT